MLSELTRRIRVIAVGAPDGFAERVDAELQRVADLLAAELPGLVVRIERDNPMDLLRTEYHVVAKPTIDPEDPRYFPLLASAYVAALRRGTPIRALARAMGRSESTTRGHVQIARNKGYLIGGKQGIPGGALSPEAEAVLGL